MPTRTQSTVIAVFRNNSDAQAAASDLKANGFQSSDLFISKDTSAAGSDVSGTTYSNTGTEHHHHEGGHHEGGIVGWFKSVFGENDDNTDRSHYENAVNSGNIFLSVDVSEDNIETAADVLNQHSPIDIHQEGGASGTAGSTASSSRAAATPTGNIPANLSGTDASRDAIPVIREELKVGKRSVLKGGVRVYSRMVEEPAEEKINLHQEQVRVQRTPVNREATASDLTPGREQVFEAKEYAEEPVVSKTARVVEEVRVSKEGSDRSETIRDTVRHTEVNVENLSGDNTAGTNLGGSSRTGAAADSKADYNTDYSDDFRSNFQSTYGSTGESYDTYRPSYEYGYQMANDPRYRNRSFSEAEPELRADYARRYPNSTWDKMKDSVSYGWNKLTGKV